MKKKAERGTFLLVNSTAIAHGRRCPLIKEFDHRPSREEINAALKSCEPGNFEWFEEQIVLVRVCGVFEARLTAKTIPLTKLER